MLFDAHFHYAVMVQRNIWNLSVFDKSNSCCKWQGLSCTHSPEEWNIQENAPDCIFKSFGIHPQLAGVVDINLYKDFLLDLAENRKLDAIGEAGFDFFSNEFKPFKDIQEDIWNFQLELARDFSLPIVVHCRKANEKLFQYGSLLKKVPAVLFHSFMGSVVEAESLIKRGINCFFSFGKQMMNNNKKVIECVRKLPLEYLLFETDGPFQTLKGEENTIPADIIRIYHAGYKIRSGMEWENKIGADKDYLYNTNDKYVNYEFCEFCKKIYGNGQKLVNIKQ